MVLMKEKYVHKLLTKEQNRKNEQEYYQLICVENNIYLIGEYLVEVWLQAGAPD